MDQEGELEILNNDFNTYHNQFENLLIEHLKPNKVSEKQQPATENDELNQYLGDIYKMYKSHRTDDAMYRVMQLYTTAGPEKIHSTNKRYMKEYEHHLDEKARMDMRVGRKPKNYSIIVGMVQKYKFEYAFIKRTQPIFEKILNE